MKFISYETDNNYKLIMDYLNKNDIDIIIYHFPCGDGFGAAFIGWYYYKTYTNKSNEIEYIPYNYNKENQVSTELYPKIKDKNVLMVDISFKRHIILEMKELCKNLMILDHHKSAEKELENIEGCYFDMTKSGIRLSYEYFIPSNNLIDSDLDLTNSNNLYKTNLKSSYLDINEVDIPELVRYIEDRDLWKWKYQETKPFTFALYNQIEYEFEEYQKIYLNRNNEVEDLINRGKHIEKYIEKLITNNLKHVSIELLEINNNLYQVGIINETNFISEMGNAIMKYYDVDFAIVTRYTHTKNKIDISLRSLNNKTDVSEIARIFGGGGHRNASGCTITIDNLENDRNVRKILESLGIIKPGKSIIINYFENIKKNTMEYLNNIWNYL